MSPGVKRIVKEMYCKIPTHENTFNAFFSETLIEKEKRGFSFVKRFKDPLLQNKQSQFKQTLHSSFAKGDSNLFL